MAQDFNCKRDELTIRGKLFGASPTEKKKTVILSHGFLANQKTCKKYAQVLESLGYLAVTYDFCGGGLGCKSDGKSQNMTVETEKRDLLAVIEYVRTLPYADCDHLTLLGCSQGGYVSAMIAAEHPEIAEKLVLYYPALCIPDDARSGRMMFYKFDTTNIPEILGRFPMKIGGEYARCVIDKDPFEQITGYTGPVLLLHGTIDKIVNLEYAKKAVSCYPDCRFEIIEGGGHGFKGKYDKQAIEIMKEFMIK